MRIYDKKRMFYTIALEDGGEKKKIIEIQEVVSLLTFSRKSFASFGENMKPRGHESMNAFY